MTPNGVQTTRRRQNDVSTNPGSSRKFVGEDTRSPLRVRIEKAHPSDPNFKGTSDPLHTVDHMNIDPLGLLVGYIGGGGGCGHGWGGKNTYSSFHSGIYGESSLTGNREWGSYIAGGEGDITGAAYSPYGLTVGLSWGTMEDFKKASKAVGFNFFGFSIEMTYDLCSDGFDGTGFSIGVLGRGFGFGSYEMDTKAHNRTIKGDYSPLISK